MSNRITAPSLVARWALVVAAGCLVLIAIDIWWVMEYRHGFPMDIDEAGYTTFGLADYLGGKNGGVSGWWDAIEGQPTFAPLVPALTSLLVLVKPGIMNGFVVLAAFLMLLSMAIYGIAERIAGPRLGALAALLAATSPGAFSFSREYVFALPTAAFLACAVYAAIRSDGLRRSRWALACGVAIGLLLLTRTMAITYVPGVLAAAIVVALARGRGDLGKRALNLGLVIVSAVAVAATWYAKNLQSVIDYLTNYGYGRQSEFYGADHALISWGRLRSVAERLTAEDLFLPLATMLLIGLVTMTLVIIRRLRPPATRRSELKRLAGTDALTVAIVFLVGYAGLMTSENGGNGFTFPLAVLLPVLAVLALRRFPAATIPAVSILVAIVVVNVVSTATVWSTASRTRLLSVPGFQEALPLTKGVPKAVFAIRAQIPGPETVFTSDDARWLDTDEQVADALAALRGPLGEAPVIGFASRNRALNTNTVNLEFVSKYHAGLPLVQLEAEPSDSVATYTDWLTNPEHGIPTVLITMSSETDDFPPVITQSLAEKAAVRLGFKRIRTIELPDRRLLYIWQKQPPKTAS